MKTTLYVFSATGNSLSTAQKLAPQLDECEIVSVASLRGQARIVAQARAIGFVFPVYYGNMPWPMREAISKMVFPADAYLFSVLTCRGHAGDAARRLDQLLRTRGQRLSLCQSVPMPGNSFVNAPEVDAEHLARQDERIAALVGPIQAREEADYACADVLPITPVGYPSNFRGIMADERCRGCGTCTWVCPMDNIRIVDGHAVIGDNCATCLACFHWCPMQAIYMSRQESISRRAKYHHPDVDLSDIVALKQMEE